MLDLITHIFLITVISWGLTQLWDMPKEFINEYKKIKKAQGRQSHKGH